MCDSYRGSTQFSTGSRHILQVTEATNQGTVILSCTVALILLILSFKNSFQFVVLAINVFFFYTISYVYQMIKKLNSAFDSVSLGY